MGSGKKVKFCYYLTFLTGAKTRGGISDKNFCNETKILSGILDTIMGRDNRRQGIKLYMDLKQFRQYMDIYVLYMVNIIDIH